MIDYLCNGDDIYRKTFGIIRAEANLDQLSDDLAHIVVRLIHACGMTDIVQALTASPNAVKAGRDALMAGALIFCDSRMVANGITRKRLPASNEIICTLNHPHVLEIAWRINNTRLAAALELWRSQMEGAVITIGNAPTTLFRLLELLDEGAPKPAIILGFPVEAAESKAELAINSRGVPFITLYGRRGGSAIAAAAVNALAKESEL
jgi:precorrin isomerase